MSKTSIMPGAEPFFFKKGKIGCLLCHGFTGTPKEVLELGKFLADNGITVIGPRLPGHGTMLEDLIPTNSDVWFKEYTNAFNHLREFCDVIFIGGLSMGAALSLSFAFDNKDIQGLILMSAPYKMNFLIRTFLAIFGTIAKKKVIRKSRKSLELAKELENLCYNSDPIGPANSLRKLLKENERRMSEITAPTLILQGLEDSNWIVKSSQMIFENISSIDKKLIFLEKSTHCITIASEKELVKMLVLNFIKEHSTQIE